MSGNRENHGMTRTESDIALLLADVTDEVEIGIAPVQAVMRGGRRRRARRWAVAGATAVVLAVASTAGTLAVTGLPGGGHRDRGGEVAVRPSSPEARHVYTPESTDLASGSYQGKKWGVGVMVWGAPLTRAEAEKQWKAMGGWGLQPADADRPADLIGRTSFFAARSYDGFRRQVVMFNTVQEVERLSGTDVDAAAARLGDDPASAGRLVVGKVATTAASVTCRWKDGTSTRVTRVPAESPYYDGQSGLRPVRDYPGADWFVCVAPQGTAYESAEVTK
ncbi:hypothetical protein AB0D38_22955 [Streptomyces sp. NPDC048279]|uniref:hypothetical protein n=1 Tax=Streptomyces sp. NPDC048279 TaxID=3154714 RepID=UPI003420DC20